MRNEVVSVLAVVVMCVACTHNGRASETPVDLQIGRIGATQSAGGIEANGAESIGGDCSVQLVAGRIEKSESGCYLDEHVSEGPGSLHFPCSGDGVAEAVFGTHRYAGHVQKNELLIELSTELDWTDGCHWGTLAAITGTVAQQGKPTLARLSWNYLDRVISGVDCSGVCNAHTSFTVSLAKAKSDTGPIWGDDSEDK